MGCGQSPRYETIVTMVALSTWLTSQAALAGLLRGSFTWSRPISGRRAFSIPIKRRFLRLFIGTSSGLQVTGPDFMLTGGAPAGGDAVLASPSAAIGFVSAARKVARQQKQAGECLRLQALPLTGAPPISGTKLRRRANDCTGAARTIPPLGIRPGERLGGGGGLAHQSGLSSMALTGLVRNSSAPHSSPSMRAAAPSRAVASITGTSRVRGSDFRRRVSS